MTAARARVARRVTLAQIEGIEARLAALRTLDARRQVTALRGLGEVDRLAVWCALADGERRAMMLAVSAVPEECGPEMRSGPAQARLVPFQPVIKMVDAKGVECAVEVGYRGRSAARVADVFDLMHARQTKAHREAHGVLFNPSQIAIARIYRALVEDVSRGNMRNVNLEGAGGGGCDDGALAAFTDRRAQVEAMRRRVGVGDAMPLRRVRPSDRGQRVAIARLALVDQVCVGQMTLSEVLERAGWVANGQHRCALRAELQECLDRMQGYPARCGVRRWMHKGS